jgi:hypothetical protein
MPLLALFGSRFVCQSAGAALEGLFAPESS